MSRRLQRQTRLMRPIKRNPSGRRFTISLREFKSAVPVRSFIYSVSSRTLFALTPRLASLIYEPAMINENAFTCSILHCPPMANNDIILIITREKIFYCATDFPANPMIHHLLGGSYLAISVQNCPWKNIWYLWTGRKSRFIKPTRIQGIPFYGLFNDGSPVLITSVQRGFSCIEYERKDLEWGRISVFTLFYSSFSSSYKYLHATYSARFSKYIFQRERHD